MGYNTIIYLHISAWCLQLVRFMRRHIIDGASRLQKCQYVDIRTIPELYLCTLYYLCWWVSNISNDLISNICLQRKYNKQTDVFDTCIMNGIGNGLYSYYLPPSNFLHIIEGIIILLPQMEYRCFPDESISFSRRRGFMNTKNLFLQRF